MKIAYLAAYFYPIRSGMENNCYYLARELAKKNDVHVFTADRKDNILLNKNEVIDGIKVHRFKVLRYKYYFYFSFRMFYEIMKNDFDIIHVHGFGFLMHDVVIFFKKIFTKTKLVCTPHGPFMALREYDFLQKLIKFFYMPFLKLVVSFYDNIIEVNNKQFDIWMKDQFGVKKSQVIFVPNGIRASEFNKRDFRKFESKYNLKGKFVINYLGRLNKYKGLDQVINVLPYIIKFYDNVVFVIMGRDGGALLELKQLTRKLKLEKHVLFIEDISDDEKFEAYEKSEIFVFPSDWEAFGISMLEAMAHGNAVVSTKTEGGEFLVEKGNGLLYNYKDLTALRDALIKLISDNKLREKMQANNIKKSRKYVWEKIVVDLEKHYKRLLK
ncbi:glycosyltransferase family 4 protein [Candidatus Woesearchaeota archaeon]|nr:glycosyltransferase family 4 protein [Candidatus Woesearchaeota archaeon]